MLDIVKKFIGEVFPVRVHFEKPEITIDATHIVTIERTPHDNVRFVGYSLIGDQYVIMASIEIETYTKAFWENAAQAVATLGQFYIGGRMPLAVVANAVAADKVPEGAYLAVERERPGLVKPLAKPRPGKRQRNGKKDESVKGEVKTVTRGELQGDGGRAS
jgi:hypothetical protein